MNGHEVLLGHLRSWWLGHLRRSWWLVVGLVEVALRGEDRLALLALLAVHRKEVLMVKHRVCDCGDWRGRLGLTWPDVWQCGRWLVWL